MALLDLAQQHQQAILRREAQAASQIGAQWQTAYTGVRAQLSTLFHQMSLSQAKGEEVNLAWLVQAKRLQQTLDGIGAQMSAFSQQSSQIVRSHAAQAQQIGQQDAHLLVTHALGSVRGVFGQPQPQALAILANRGASNPRIADLFARMDAQTKRTVRQRLMLGVSLGNGPRQIAADIQHALSKPLNGALTIARTESMNAYRDGTLSIYQANADVLNGWEWLAEPDACPYCQSMNGSIHSLDEGMDEHPNGRCTMLPVVKSDEELLAA